MELSNYKEQGCLCDPPASLVVCIYSLCIHYRKMHACHMQIAMLNLPQDLSVATQADAKLEVAMTSKYIPNDQTLCFLVTLHGIL